MEVAAAAAHAWDDAPPAGAAATAYQGVARSCGAVDRAEEEADGALRNAGAVVVETCALPSAEAVEGHAGA